MDSYQFLINGLNSAIAYENILACFFGCLVGTLIGVLPGIGPIATMAILLPFTFTLDPTTAIIMLAGVYYGSQYGGSTTSILVNIPGEVGSIMTCQDGYQMARKGRAGAALGISAIGSFVGGTFGLLGLMVLVPPLAKIALSFGPPEVFSLMLFGLIMISAIGTGSLLKSLLMATFGMFISLVGQEPFLGFSRFTFGSNVLEDGVGLLPVIMGMYGISEVLFNIETINKQKVLKTDIRSLLPNREEWRASRGPILRGSLIGFFLGILPGAGVVVTTFFSYWLEKRVSKDPTRFGKGAIEGVAGPETANNAAVPGSMVPLLALGIPSSPTMAILLGAFIIQGIQPGPLFIVEQPTLFWGVVGSMYIGNLMLVILNLPLIGLWVRILTIPFQRLFPLIIVFCLIGVYSLNNNVFELVIMIFFGVIGYFLRKMDYSFSPFVLAMVLGPMMETGFRQSMGISRGSLLIFFQRPFSATLIALVFVVGAISLILSRKKKQRLSQDDLGTEGRVDSIEGDG